MSIWVLCGCDKTVCFSKRRADLVIISADAADIGGLRRINQKTTCGGQDRRANDRFSDIAGHQGVHAS